MNPAKGYSRSMMGCLLLGDGHCVWYLRMYKLRHVLEFIPDKVFDRSYSFRCHLHEVILIRKLGTKRLIHRCRGTPGSWVGTKFMAAIYLEGDRLFWHAFPASLALSLLITKKVCCSS